MWLPLLGLVVASTAIEAQERPIQPAADRAAVVNGVTITAADVDAKLGSNLAKLQEQIYTLRQKQLDTMIDQRLLEDEAAKRGVTVAAMVQSEITEKVVAATPEEAAKFFAENKARLQGDLPALQDQIKAFLTAQRLQARQQEFLQTLRGAAKIETFLAAPAIFRSTVVTAGAPVRGSLTAPVTIVEFSDFHCPYCKRIQPVLDQVLAKYAGKVKLVFRDFPIDGLHPQARAASEAARCATEQGKFWEFHDVVFKSDPDATPATLDRIAKEIGLDLNAFTSCRTSGKYKTPVQASNQEGTALGITGTPTFFINGRILVGAQPVEAFSKIIDEELAGAPPGAGR
jgi:protein-disulfide isomerase